MRSSKLSSQSQIQINLFLPNILRKTTTSEYIKKNSKYVLAVIIKVLQNSPSKIWYHLDNNEYLKAAM